MIGQTIRKFEIQGELGAGGYGAVYKAHDSSVDRDVAIKVILPQYADQEDFKQRFESEARLVAQLESRQIVPLYDYWQDEQGAFLVMRLIRGGSLRKIMAKQGAMSLSQTVRIVSDIAEALSVAHENDVVHRDLKPENILIDERGNAYLTDFGIAKRTTEPDNITEADAIVGTFAYLSPEQVQNVDVTPQTDIYAFGILLYEMLTGKHPFHGSPVATMVMRQLQENLPDLNDERPDLPHELDDIIQKATAKDPSERYANTLELVADLKSAAHESNQNLAPIKTIQPKKPSSPEERNRQAMLQNVRKFWVEGVLENSVQDAILLNLGKTGAAHQINNPWDTVVRTPHSGDEVLSSDASILEIFEQMNGKLLILGEPGGGKTTMLLELARDLLNLAEIDDAHPMPVVFNLSSWVENQLPLEEWLVSELSNKYQVPYKVGAKWVENEELLLLLDGLDEVKAEARDACVEVINTYRTEHGFVDMVVCSRMLDYEDLSDKLLLNGAIVIQPLTDEQIDLYLQQLGAVAEIPRQLINQDEELRELASTPLMLNIITQAYQDATGDVVMPDSLEARRAQVFERYVENAILRRGKSEYSLENTKRYLSWMATTMQLEGNTIFQMATADRHWIPPKHQMGADILTTTQGLFILLVPFMIFSWGFAQLIDVPIYMIIPVTILGIFSFLTAMIVRHFQGSNEMKNNIFIPVGFAMLVAGTMMLLMQFQRDVSIEEIVTGFVSISIYHFAFYQTISYLMSRYNYKKDAVQLKRIENLSFKREAVQFHMGIYGFGFCASATVLMGIFMYPDSNIFMITVATFLGGFAGALLSIWQSGLEPNNMQVHTDFQIAMKSSMRVGYRAALIGFIFVSIPIFVSGLILGIEISTLVLITITLASIHGLIWWAYVGGGGVAVAYNTFNLLDSRRVPASLLVG